MDDQTKTPPELEPRRRDQEPTSAEIAVAQAYGRTQGRRGCKAVRINMAIQPDNYLYIRTMAKVRGQTVTKFCNDIFAESRKRNSELYEKAKEFVKQFEEGEAEE